MKRLVLLASSLLVLAAFPASGAAASHGSGILYSDSVQVRAYKMQLIAIPKTPHSGAGLNVIFSRGSSTDKQEHYYGFTHKVHVTLAPGGTSATVKADMGAYGRIDMTFSAGGGGRNTPGCPGSLLSQHPGRLAGSFHFKSHSSYFGTIDKGSIPAFTAYGKKANPCKPPARPKVAHGTELQTVSTAISGPVTQPLITENFFDAVRDAKGHISEGFLVLDSSRVHNGGPAIYHVINLSKLPASSFTNSGLSSAQATASGMFMNGNLTFTTTGMLGPHQATGSVSGSIVANFDGLAPITVPTPRTQANLDVT
ncbi:MAG: hypothetical protein M3018_03645 [Actinomycetota bacterium]|nr:hypothetical protein [Actinomycetota bacterium]